MHIYIYFVCTCTFEYRVHARCTIALSLYLESFSDLFSRQRVAVVAIQRPEQVDDAQILLGVVQDFDWVTVEDDVTSLSLQHGETM